MRGGRWGYIDRDGVEVVAVEFELADLQPPPDD
jgi:hypothetical protein